MKHVLYLCAISYAAVLLPPRGAVALTLGKADQRFNDCREAAQSELSMPVQLHACVRYIHESWRSDSQRARAYAYLSWGLSKSGSNALALMAAREAIHEKREYYWGHHREGWARSCGRPAEPATMETATNEVPPV